ncbi:MAG: methyltransferase domain-containing protein [Chromatiales bacterium]|nr:methyltransferase domain-containing protein [Chromatiales bacterium]
MSTDIRDKWNQRHAAADGIGSAAEVLVENRHLLPKQGEALDLACGRGANALLLAEAGLSVTAWDISDVAITRLRAAAEAERLDIRAQVRDLALQPPEPNSFDLIVVSYYLDRALMPHLVEALREGGLLFYQTFNQSRLTGLGPGNPAFRLKENELLTTFSSLQTRFYRDNGSLGDTSAGVRDVSLYVGEKLSTDGVIDL